MIVGDKADMETVTEVEVEKMEHLLMSCPGCEKRYSEDIVPMGLPCGHSLCTLCVKLTHDGHISCPECRIKRLITHEIGLPRNFQLLRFIRSVKEKNIILKDFIVADNPFVIPKSDPHENAGMCPAHDSPLIFLCVSCSSWICRDCLVVDHAYVPRGSCRVLTQKEALAHIRQAIETNKALLIKDLELIRDNLVFELARYEFSLKHCCSQDLRSHSRLTRFVENDLGVLRREGDAKVECVMECIKELTERVKRTTSPKEMNSRYQEFEDCHTDLKAYLAGEKCKKESLLRNILSHLKMDLKCLLSRGVTVYALLRGAKEEKCKWALVTTTKDNRLLMYPLQDDEPPKDSVIIPYEHLLEEKKRVFFEIKHKEEVLGRVYISLVDTALGKHVLMMCTGEKGHTFRNTSFLLYEKRKGLLKGGAYESNDVVGGHLLRKEQACRGEVVTTSLSQCSQLCFKFDDSHISTYKVGNVTEGFNILKKVSELESVNEAVISNCGLFIPMNDKDSLT